MNSVDKFGKYLRMLPGNIPGSTRIKKALANRFYSRSAAVFNVNGVEYSVPSLKEPVAFHLWANGAYEPELQNIIRNYWRRGTTFLDIGANIGSISIPLALSIDSGGGVIGFEASPSIYPYLEENLRLNACANYEAIQCAVCDEDGAVLDFNEAPEEKFGMGSLGTKFDAPSVQVEGRTLDSLLAERGWPEVSVMKVDVEGFEAAVFMGAEKLLKELRPVVIFEFCDWAEKNSGRFHIGESQEILLKSGFSLYEIDSGKLVPLPEVKRTGYSNFVAMR